MDQESDTLLFEVEDEIYSCKKCDKILEEGRAFELGGNRWHVECFRCSNCNSQLNCDANLLVLGNGNLICGNCCYSCCVCGNKIEDLAILTGKDTAFCSSCFKCRNCKRPIENLRYARTSQGIFCMDCHQKLMDRRKRNNGKRRTEDSLKDNDILSLERLEGVAANDDEKSSNAVEPLNPTVFPEKQVDRSSTNTTDPSNGDETDPTLAQNDSESIYESSTEVSGSLIRDQLSERSSVDSSRRTSISSTLSTSTLASFSRSSKGFLSELSSRRSSANFLSSKVRRISRSFTLDGSSSRTIGSSQVEAETSKGDLSTEFVFPSNDASHAQPASDNNRSSIIGISKSDSSSASLSSKSSNIDMPKNSTSSRSNQNAGILRPPIDFSKSKTGKHQQKRSVSSATASSFFNSSKKAFTRSHSISVNHTDSEGSDNTRSENLLASSKSSSFGLAMPFAKKDPSGHRFINSSPSVPYEDLPKYGTDNYISFQHYKAATDELSNLKYELVKSSQRVVELEAFINMGTPNADLLEKKILEDRQLLANLQSQTSVAWKELDILKWANSVEHKEDGDLSIEIVTRLRHEVESVKASLSSEIEDLISQRNELLDENMSLAKLKEMSLKSLKTLAPANKIVSDSSGISKNSHALAKGSINNSGLADTKNKGQDILQSKLCSENASFDVESGATNSGRKFWRRGGAAAAVAKVKGLNKLFNSDGIGAVVGLDHPIIENKAGSTGMNGLAIVLPKSSSANSALHSLSNTGGGSKFRGMKFKVSSTNGSSALDKNILQSLEIGKLALLEGRKIPLIVTRCVEEVEARGLDYEGIYRKSGVKSQIVSIQGAADNTFDVEQQLNDYMLIDICGVTSVLKQYLRYLPEPLITYNAYLKFVSLADIHEFEKKLNALVNVIKSLPESHQRCLEYLFQHLTTVASYSHKNLMTARNIAVVFAPSLVRDYSGSREIMDAQKKNLMVQFMIENKDRVFSQESEMV
ncbi:hypothetical protein V1514DRAFT_275223 [Lipomyces japonicus]|uniref:uncharacterized protein n=1 Tax=Lipomyces japonicus TaxID=56871 RepID=UPI0034CF26BB